MSYERVAVMGIYRLHKCNDLADSVEYVSDLAAKYGLKDQDRIEEYQSKLHKYAVWMETDQPIVVASKVNIRHTLADDVYLAGEFSRVDIDLGSGGYRAILLTDKDLAWREELRMPLIQVAIAKRYERVTEQVAVGVQRIDGSGLSTRVFSSREIVRANEEAIAMAKIIGAESAFT